MGKRDRLPPGPNPRGDQMTEKDQRQLRETQGQSPEGEPWSATDDVFEWEQADQAEGERDEEPATRIGRTPGQAEGDREDVDAQLRSEEREHRT